MIDCKSSTTASHCFWHNVFGCISISESPTLHPNPTLEPTAAPSTHTIISTLTCGDIISGRTSFAHHIDYYLLHIDTPTDLLLDSCNSTFDTWLFMEDAHGPMVDCDDCGQCGLQSQINVNLRDIGTYIVGIGGYKQHFGEYILRISCSLTLAPSPFPTSISTKNPTPKPTMRPTMSPTPIPSEFPTFDPTPYPTPNPSIYPTMKPITTVMPTLRPSEKPTLSPSFAPTHRQKETTNYLTQYPSMSQTTESLNSNLSLTAAKNVEQLFNVQDESEYGGKNDELLIGMLLSIMFIGLCVGIWYGLKWMDRTKKYHLNMGIDEEEEEEDEDEDDDGDLGLGLDDVDIMNLIHCNKRNSVNNLNVDDIVERATIDLINLSKMEKDISLVITNGGQMEEMDTETETKQ